MFFASYSLKEVREKGKGEEEQKPFSAHGVSP